MPSAVASGCSVAWRPTPEVISLKPSAPKRMHHSVNGMYSSPLCALYDVGGQLLPPDTAGQTTAGRFGSGHFSRSILLTPVFGSMDTITFCVFASIENRYSP